MEAPLRILVVDDDIDSATSLTRMLRLLGHRAVAGFGGRMGVRIAELFAPNLVFLDLELPGMTGCDVLADIKALDGDVSQAFFVCLTGSSSDDCERRCREAGFDHFVRKPMSADRLMSIIEAAQAMAPSWHPASSPDASRASPFERAR